MTVRRPADAVVHRMHGSTFSSYVAPASGSQQLCAWELTVSAGSVGVEHRVSHEEILCVTEGSLIVPIDKSESAAGVGDVVLVPAGSWFAVSSADGARAWVTTSVGLTAQTADGQLITPAWTV